STRFEKAEEIASDLKAQLREVNLARQAQHEQSFRASGTEDEVVRSYAVDGDELKTDRSVRRPHHVNDLDDVGSCREGAAFVGRSGEGVVRMLGGEQHGMFRWGLLDDPHPRTPWQRELQQLVDLRSLAKMAMSRRSATGGALLAATPKLDAAIAYHLRRGPTAIAKVFADNAGEGAEWLIPSLTMPETYRKAELPRQVAALFPVVNLQTGDATKNPFQTRGLQPFILGTPPAGERDPAEIRQTVPTTTEVSTTPQTVGVNLPADRDATEDAIMAFGPMAQMLVAEAIQDGREDALINGDTGVHGDTGIASWNPRSRWHADSLGLSVDHRYWYTGLRHQAIDASANVNGGSAQTVVGLGQFLAQLDTPHAYDSVVYVCSPEFVLIQLLTDTNLLTVDKYGPQATVLTGEVGRIFGRPIVLSEFVDVAYNASGIYDGTTQTKTGTLIVNRSRMYRGVRRSLRVETEVQPRTNTNYTVASVRESFGRVDPAATKSVAWIYNQDPA
ncbi:MAG: phage major capsid protein, partial [Myxococcota bacterium]